MGASTIYCKNNPELSPVIYIYTGFQLFLQTRWAHNVFLLPPYLSLFYYFFLLVFRFLEKSILSFSFFPFFFHFLSFSPQTNSERDGRASAEYVLGKLRCSIYQCLFAFFVFVYLILNFGPYPQAPGIVGNDNDDELHRIPTPQHPLTLEGFSGLPEQSYNGPPFPPVHPAISVQQSGGVIEAESRQIEALRDRAMEW